MPEASIPELLTTLNQNAAVLGEFAATAGLPQPSHSNLPPPATGPPPPLPDAIAKAKADAKEACYELYHLLLDPPEILFEAVISTSKILALSFINRFQIAQKIPPGQSKSFQELATECGVAEDDVRRVLRMGMTEHLFVEPEPDRVAHTTASLMILAIPNFDAWVWNMGYLNLKSISQLPDAIAKWPGSQEPKESAYTMAHHGTGVSFFENLAQNPKESERFGQSMAFVANSPPFSVNHFIQAYDFSHLPADAKFVDVGGSHGMVAIEVAKKLPQIHCVVQDVSEPTLAAGRESLPAEVKGRVEFMVYDFWEVQPVVGADIYYFRWVFHDWSDRYSIKLLQNLIPALKKGSRIVINDVCMPPKGVVSLYQERMLRNIDCVMKSVANAKERNEAEWRALFAQANPGFKMQPVVQPPQCTYAIIEAIWEP